MTDLGLIWQEALLCQYSGGLLQYSLVDYSSTCIGLLQYFYWITPGLLSDSIKVLTHASPPNPFPRQLANLFTRQLPIIYIVGR